MAAPQPQFLDVGTGDERRRIAYLREPAAAGGAASRASSGCAASNRR